MFGLLSHMEEEQNEEEHINKSEQFVVGFVVGYSIMYKSYGTVHAQQHSLCTWYVIAQIVVGVSAPTEESD